MIAKDKPPGEGKVSVMTREIIKEGLRIKHPSGVVATTRLEDLKRLREITQGFIAMNNQQLKMIDDDIARVEAFRKAHPGQ